MNRPGVLKTGSAAKNSLMWVQTDKASKLCDVSPFVRFMPFPAHSDEETQLLSLWAQAYLSCPIDTDPVIWFARQLRERETQRAQALIVQRLEGYQFTADITVWHESTKKDLVRLALSGAVAEARRPLG